MFTINSTFSLHIWHTLINFLREARKARAVTAKDTNTTAHADTYARMSNRPAWRRSGAVGPSRRWPQANADWRWGWAGLGWARRGGSPEGGVYTLVATPRGVAATARYTDTDEALCSLPDTRSTEHRDLRNSHIHCATRVPTSGAAVVTCSACE